MLGQASELGRVWQAGGGGLCFEDRKVSSWECGVPPFLDTSLSFHFFCSCLISLICMLYAG